MKLFAILTLFMASLWFSGCGSMLSQVSHEGTANAYMAQAGAEQVKLFSACTNAAMETSDVAKLERIESVCLKGYDAWDRFEADWGALAMTIQASAANPDEERIAELEAKVAEDVAALVTAVNAALAELKAMS